MIRDIKNKNDEVQTGDKELNALKHYFPQCFKDGNFDIEAFKAALPGGLSITDETLGFNFLGKNYARLLANMDTTTLIKPDREHNALPENKDSQNVYISGDNLDALQHLLKSYTGRVKVIYIDPPYNTGGDGFVYNDKFTFTPEQISDRIGVSQEQAERILSMTRRGSASHAAWLTFMLPRLSLARDLLTNDGVIFISIDDNEQANLRLLCDEIFGEENFVATIPWRKRTAKSDVPFGVSQDYEWVVVYAASEDFIAGIDGKNRKYFETPDFPGREWRVHDMSTQRSATERPNSDFTIVNPKNGEEFPVNPRAVWRITKDGFPQYLKENRIVFPGDYDFLHITKPVLRYWKDDDIRKAGGRFGQYALSTQLPADIGMTQDGTKDFEELFSENIFKFPKPVKLIRYLIEAAIEKDIDEPQIVLDFFSGSATTAQAVMQLNSLDDGYNLKYILVQLQEQIDENTDAYKAGYRTIDQIGMERIRRAAKKVKEENPLFATDLGFRHYTLIEPERKVLDEMESFDPQAIFPKDTTLETLGVDTILCTWLEADGYGLTAKPEEVKLGKYTAYYIGEHLYLINKDDTFDVDAMVDLMDKYNGEVFSPQNVVLYGYSFGVNNRIMLKTNLRTLKDGNKSLKVNLDVRY